jgi:hypothetical protein
MGIPEVHDARSGGAAAAEFARMATDTDITAEEGADV